MIRPDFTTLRIFLAVYNLGNISKAAEYEHIAPSAISKRIQALESELGTVLFYRHARGMNATPAGEALARHTVKLLDDVNRLAADLNGFASGVRGQVRIHAHTSAVVQYLPERVSTFIARYPDVTVALKEEPSSQVIQSTVDGLTDIGIFAGNMEVPDVLKVFEYHRDHLGVLVHPKHPLAQKEHIYFEEIRDSDYISLETGSSLQILLAEAAEAAGFTLRTKIRVGTFEAAARMVEAGLGVAILPLGIFRPTAKGDPAQHLALRNEWATRKHLLCVRDEHLLTRAAFLMLDHLRSSVKCRALPNHA